MAFRGFSSFLHLAAFAVAMGTAPMASAQQNAITGETFTAGTTGALAIADPLQQHQCRAVFAGAGRNSSAPAAVVPRRFHRQYSARVPTGLRPCLSARTRATKF